MVTLVYMICIFLKGTTHMTMKFLGRWQRRNMETEETRMSAMLASRDCAADASFRCIAVWGMGDHSHMTSAQKN